MFCILERMIQNIQCKDSFDTYFPFAKHLSQQEEEELCDKTRPVKYPKGALLQTPGEKCLGILQILSGELRVYMVSEEGREITLYRLSDGDSCILSASCILEAITFDVFIEAESDVSLLQIPTAEFQNLASKNIYVEAFAYKLTTQRFSEVMWAMQQILFMSFDKRLAIFLIDESVKTKNENVLLSHEQIAKYMGSAREVVSRMLKYFAQEGIVKLSRKNIQILDRKKLRALTVKA